MLFDSSRRPGRLWPLVACAVTLPAVASGCLRRSAQSADTSTTTTAAPASELKPRGKGEKLTAETAITPPEGRKTPVAQHGQLSVKGAQMVDASGQPVTLRGQAFGWDNWWPQYYNASVVRWLWEDWCVDVVRPAMGIEPEGAFLSNPEASTQRIEAVVDGAIEAGVYVIIDWHAHNLHQPEAVAFFAKMAAKYGSKPNVIYEIFNEPEKDETWPQVAEYATAVIGAIRQHDPDNIVIVGSPEWDQRIDLVAQNPLPLTNVMYSVHFYADTHRDWLRDRTKQAVSKGVAVIVSESSGSQASGQGQNNYREWQAWIDFMEDNHISWLNYSVSDKAGETCSILEPGSNAAGGWTAAELTDSGEHVRNLLRSYCGK
jgi:aryl-phospho-beta-D-glucosidase BglC (GH1 family)